MKTYEKPRLMALSLRGNDQLCGSCDTKLRDDSGLAEFINDSVHGALDKNKDGQLTADEFSNVFARGEQGCAEEHDIVGYCKFTSGGTMIAWS